MKKILLFLLLIISAQRLFAQESISVISQGTGDSYEMARNNCLRNAIEKIYGAFVSTSTLVNNGQLQKDEIYTFSSGNFNNYQEISSVVVNGKYSVTLKVIMSKQKLATFIKSNGKNIEYDAREFVSGIKAKVINEKLAEESEVNIVSALVDFANRVFPDCIDYEIKASEPYLGIIYGWSLQLELKFATNKNLDILNQHIHKTLSAIDYNYVDQPQNDWGFKCWTSDKYPEVSEVIPGSAAAISQLKRGDKIVGIRAGELGDFISLKGKARELSDMLANFSKANQNISLEIEPREEKVNARKGTISYDYGDKKIILMKPSTYAIRTKRTHDDREDLGKATYTINYNGSYYEMRSNASRTMLHNFVAYNTWRTITGYQVAMDAGKYSKRILLRPVVASRNNDFRSSNPQYCVFTYHLEPYMKSPVLELKEYKGIDAEESAPSDEIYIKDALRYYVAQDEVANIRLPYLSALFSCIVEFSENKENSLDAISSIKGFKVIKP